MQRESAKTLVGLSVGTTKISAVVAIVDQDSRYPNTIQVLGMGCAPSRGLLKGVIVNLSDATRSVRKAFREAENIVGQKIDSAIVAFNSLDVQSVTTQGMVALGGREPRRVEDADFVRAIEAAQSSLEVSKNMLAVHTIPVRYTLDDRPVDEPLNMTGTRLEIMLQTVFVPRTYVQNIMTCVQDAEVEVRGLVLKPLAASLGALTDEEMQAGCISLSIGGGATGLVLYQAGRPSKIMSIPIGGEHITSDLSSMLRISMKDAENVKKRLFIPGEEEELKRDGIDIDLAVQVIGERVAELFEDYVRVALADCSPQSFSAGVILSGGVAKTPGISEMLEDILQMRVRFARPFYPMPPGRDDMSYVSEAGLIRYPVYRNRYSHMFIDPVPSDINNVMSNVTTTTNSGLDLGTSSSRPQYGYDDRDSDVSRPRSTRSDYDKPDDADEYDDYDDYDDDYDGKERGKELRDFLSNMGKRVKETFGGLF